MRRLCSACAYRSPQLLRVPEQRLGVLYWALVLALVALSLLFMFSGGLHQECVAGLGTVSARVNGKAFVGSRGYDPADLGLGAQESDGVFIATRIVTQRGQEKGVCLDYDRPCPCSQGHACIGGFCQGTSWCPSLGDGNVMGPPPGAPAEAGADPTVERLEGLGKLTLSLAVGISFPGLSDRFFVAGQTPGARYPFGNLTLSQLLAQANPPLNLEPLIDYGAIVGVSFYWACDLQGATVPCEPSVLVQRLDGVGGYHLKRGRPYFSGGAERRDAVYAFGLRLQVTSSGEGRQVTASLFMLQVASVLALLRLAPLVVDLVLKQAYPDDYRRQKVLTTQKDSQSSTGPRIENMLEHVSKHQRIGPVDLTMGPAFGGVQSILWPRGAAPGHRASHHHRQDHEEYDGAWRAPM